MSRDRSTGGLLRRRWCFISISLRAESTKGERKTDSQEPKSKDGRYGDLFSIIHLKGPDERNGHSYDDQVREYVCDAIYSEHVETGSAPGEKDENGCPIQRPIRPALKNSFEEEGDRPSDNYEYHDVVNDVESLDKRHSFAKEPSPEKQNRQFDESEDDLLRCLVRIFVFLSQYLKTIRHWPPIHDNGMTSHHALNGGCEKDAVQTQSEDLIIVSLPLTCRTQTSGVGLENRLTRATKATRSSA